MRRAKQEEAPRIGNLRLYLADRSNGIVDVMAKDAENLDWYICRIERNGIRRMTGLPSNFGIATDNTSRVASLSPGGRVE